MKHHPFPLPLDCGEVIGWQENSLGEFGALDQISEPLATRVDDPDDGTVERNQRHGGDRRVVRLGSLDDVPVQGRDHDEHAEERVKVVLVALQASHQHRLVGKDADQLENTRDSQAAGTDPPGPLAGPHQTDHDRRGEDQGAERLDDIPANPVGNVIEPSEVTIEQVRHRTHQSHHARGKPHAVNGEHHAHRPEAIAAQGQDVR